MDVHGRDHAPISLRVLPSTRPASVPASMLGRIGIAAPCSADWNSMTGDDKRRYCCQCRLHVTNLSAMSRQEAERFAAEAIGRTHAGQRVCVQFYRRADGTILTQDCPVGLAARARHRARAMSMAAVAFAGLVAASLGSTLRIGPNIRWLQTDSLARTRLFAAVQSVLRSPAAPMGSVVGAMRGEVYVPPPPAAGPGQGQGAAP